MSFITDKQTLDDLNLMGRFKSDSIFSIFNKVKTTGGERLLEEMFRFPLTDPKAINERSAIFKYFQGLNLNFPFTREVFSSAENYLGIYSAPNILMATAATLQKKMTGSLLRDDSYTTLTTGLKNAISTLRSLQHFIRHIDIDLVGPAKSVFANRRLQEIIKKDENDKLTVFEVARYDYILRREMRTEMETLLDIIYRIDVYISVSSVATLKNLHYAKALNADENLLNTSALWHPAVDKAVANPIELDEHKNLIFLTGANMAGKSTLMKSFGIAVYLSHMGFPVAAKDMQFSVRDGLYSSINVADNLNMGYSHFYAEVLRVKRVAQTVSSGKRMIVIFDELFKGTNVKDAYDATLAVTTAFAKYYKCCFIISTHIIEVGTVLGERCSNITFSYLPTIIEGSVPRYTYRIKEGITNDRQGMMIIRNEGVIEMINGTKQTQLLKHSST